MSESGFKRLTAHRTSIFNILNAPYIPVDNGADYLDFGDFTVSRVRVIGTVVSKKIADDMSYAFLTIDDGTEVIGVSSSKDFKTGETNVIKFEEINIGDIVEVVGRVREWDGRRKIQSEILKIIKEPNHWLYHKIELLGENRVANESNEETDHVIDLNEMIISLIKENDVGDGISLSFIVEELKIDEEEVKESLKKLLIEGLIYEPTKYHYKVL